MKVLLLVIRSVDRMYNITEMMAEVSSMVNVECVSFNIDLVHAVDCSASKEYEKQITCWKYFIKILS